LRQYPQRSKQRWEWVRNERKEPANKDIVKEQKKFRLKCLSSEDQNIGNVYLVIRLGSGGTLL
jgi:hypothetical protein